MVFWAKVKGGSPLGVLNLRNICMTKDLTTSLFAYLFVLNGTKRSLILQVTTQSNQTRGLFHWPPTALTCPANADFNNL